jgi:hypothetical protein
MAFTLNTFQFGRGITTSYANGGGVSAVFHTYKSPDTIAAINTAGYFPDSIDGSDDKIFADDLLLIEASDATNLVKITTVNPFVYGGDLFGSASGLTVGAINPPIDNNGAFISGGVLHMEFTDGLAPGILTATGTQSIGGLKRFTTGVRFGESPGGSTLDFYDEFVFTTTMTCDDFTSAPINFSFVRVGEMVTVNLNTPLVSGAITAPTNRFEANAVVPNEFIPVLAGTVLNGYWRVIIGVGGVGSGGEIEIDVNGGLTIFASPNRTVLFNAAGNTIDTGGFSYNVLNV